MRNVGGEIAPKAEEKKVTETPVAVDEWKEEELEGLSEAEKRLRIREREMEAKMKARERELEEKFSKKFAELEA